MVLGIANLAIKILWRKTPFLSIAFLCVEKFSGTDDYILKDIGYSKTVKLAALRL